MAKNKVLYNGIYFDSAFERNVYQYFEQHPDITIISLQNEYELYESFKTTDPNGKTTTVRKCSYTPDIRILWRDKVIEVEPHAFARPEFKLRTKIFKNIYIKNNPDLYFLIFKNIKEVESYFGNML